MTNCRKLWTQLVLALLVEVHESWQVGRRYLAMQDVVQEAAADEVTVDEAATALRVAA